MVLETRIAIAADVCEREYGEKLLQVIDAALRLQPNEKPDFVNVAMDAEKARADKKNTDENNVTMSVPKAKNEWTTLTLPFADYRAALLEQTKNL